MQEVKETSLIYLEELFKKTGVIHKFIFGRDCYFNGTHYKYLTVSAFCALCKKKLDRSVQGQITRMQSYTDLYTYAIENDSSIRDFEIRENFYISFKNGVLDVKTFELSQHNQRYEVMFTIDADIYLPESEEDAYMKFENTRMYRFLYAMCNGDDQSILLILQMLGFCALNVTPKRIFFWLGPTPASGKSILLNVMAELYGPTNCCHINAHEMGVKFSQAQLYDCRVNLGQESCGTLNSVTVSMIKSLSGDASVAIERKYRARQDFPNFCKLVFASNEPIDIGETDNSDAFWERCKVIACLNSCEISKRDTGLAKILWDEREDWLPVVVYETRRLIESGFRFVEPEVSKTLKHQWRYMNENPVATFVRERLVISSCKTGFISTQELLGAYVEHTGSNPMASNSFSRLLSKYSQQPLITQKGPGPNGRRVNGFMNVQLVDHKKEETY